MKKLFMLGMCALTISLVGCSKASKYESILRETAKTFADAAIKDKMKGFKELSDEKQAEELAKLEKALKELKEKK